MELELDEQNQSQSTTQDQPKKQKKEKSEQVTVDEGEYNEYTQLKFISFSGTKFTEETKKRLDELEAKIKSCSGKRPIITVRAAIKNEQVLLVQGMPIPEKVYEIIKNADATKYYLGE